jgi:hypothetical protein
MEGQSDIHQKPECDVQSEAFAEPNAINRENSVGFIQLCRQVTDRPAEIAANGVGNKVMQIKRSMLKK